MTHFDLSAERLFRAMPITTQTSRIPLMGALVEPIETGGAWIVATNGMSMLIQRDRAAVAPKKAILRVSAIYSRKIEVDDEDFQTGYWDWCGARIHIPADVSETPVAAPVRWFPKQPAGTHVVVETAADADEYPDWRKAITATSGAAGIQASLSVALLKVLIGGGLYQFRIHPADPGQTQLISFDDDPDSLGVIMPCMTSPESSTAFAALLADIGRADAIPEPASDHGDPA